MKSILFSLLLLLLAHAYGHNKFVSQRPTTANEMENQKKSDLISNGVDKSYLTSPKMHFTDLDCLKLRFSSETSCEQTYGVLPSTTSVMGNLFLMGVYGFFMFKAANFLLDGSELLLQMMGPGIIGGLLLPILVSLPDAILIFVSGMSGSKETAQQQVLIGMGLLAGSIVMLLTALWGSCLIVGKCDLSEVPEAIDSKDTKGFSLEVSGISGTKATAQSQVLIGMGLLSGSTVMLLTALWGSCLVVGKCDLSEVSEAIDSQNTKGFSLSGSGVTVDKSTRKASWIMVATILPFIIAQIPLIFGLKSAKHLSVLIACIVALLSLLGYCVFQILEPWIQKRRLAFLKHRHIMSSILHMQQKRHGILIKDNGEPNEDVIDKVFENLDEDHDEYLTKGELRGLIVGFEMEDPELDITRNVDKIMADFDVEIDGRLTRQEFREGMCKWIRMATSTVGPSNQDSVAAEFHMKSKEELEALMDNEEKSSENLSNKSNVYLKAGSLLLLGAVIAGVFADPLVDAVDNFSDATGIPSFFISFIAMPFATNSSEAISAVIFASRKKKRTASLTYSEIYGAVTMNNTLCLGVFLAIVYLRGLDWDFSAEVLVILVVIIVTGILGSIYTTYKLWMSFIAFLMYPLSLVIVYVLDYQLGWT